MYLLKSKYKLSAKLFNADLDGPYPVELGNPLYPAIDENNYEGTAGDVVGKAKGFSYGPAFKFEYVLLVPVKGKEIKITFDDWIFKQDDRVAINRATMTKFGFKVAELTVVFVKD